MLQNIVVFSCMNSFRDNFTPSQSSLFCVFSLLLFFSLHWDTHSLTSFHALKVPKISDSPSSQGHHAREKVIPHLWVHHQPVFSLHCGSACLILLFLRGKWVQSKPLLFLIKERSLFHLHSIASVCTGLISGFQPFMQNTERKLRSQRLAFLLKLHKQLAQGDALIKANVIARKMSAMMLPSEEVIMRCKNLLYSYCCTAVFDTRTKRCKWSPGTTFCLWMYLACGISHFRVPIRDRHWARAAHPVVLWVPPLWWPQLKWCFEEEQKTQEVDSCEEGGLKGHMQKFGYFFSLHSIFDGLKVLNNTIIDKEAQPASCVVFLNTALSWWPNFQVHPHHL